MFEGLDQDSIEYVNYGDAIVGIALLSLYRNNGDREQHRAFEQSVFEFQSKNENSDYL